MEKKDLDRLHEVELEILIEFDRICKSNNIKYFLDSGSALGAIRHEGFIPWDDDIDVGMLRKDYDKFLEVVRKDLNEKFFIQILETDPEYNKMHAKLRKNGTQFIEEANANRCMHHGIFIDIFPFDNVPSVFGKIIIKCNQFLQKMVSYIQEEKYVEISKYKMIIARLFLGKKNIQKRFDKCCTLFNKCDTKYVTSYSYINKEQLLYKREWFTQVLDVNFENRSFYIMQGYDGYLKRIYGDYMKLPPVDKRYTHSPQVLDFGENDN